MAPIKVGIVEDELLIADEIADALTKLGYEPTEAAVGYTEALEMIKTDRPDVLLIDIQLSGNKDGVDLARKLKEEYSIPFIFLTANSDRATVERAKQALPNAYLVKPFNKDELYTSIELCLHSYAVSKKANIEERDNYIINNCLFIKQAKSFHKVKVDDILYIESNDVYIHLYTVNQQKLLVRGTMQKYMELLGDKHFFRVHRSFAVNTDYIQTINTDSIVIKNVEIPLAKAYRDELLKFLPIA